MDDRFRRLDRARDLRGHQSHRAGTITRLGTRDASRAAVRILRLAALRVSHARRLRALAALAVGAPASGASRIAAPGNVAVVLRRVGHLRSGVANDFDPHLRARSLSNCNAERSRSVLASGWR